MGADTQHATRLGCVPRGTGPQVGTRQRHRSGSDRMALMPRTTSEDRAAPAVRARQEPEKLGADLGASPLYTADGLPIALLSDRQAAGIAGCGRTLIRERIADGSIRAVKLGKSLRVDAESLMAWIRSRPAARLRADVRRAKSAA